MRGPTRVLLILIVVFIVAQFFRPERTNPSVDQSRTLRATGTLSPAVAAIFDRSCNDCHSNLTVWPWYAQIAPVSWFLASHVTKGRRELNFSEWATYADAKKAHKLDAICDEVQHRDMPLKTYLPFHPRATLSDADRQTICSWTAGQLAAFSGRGIQPAAHHHD